MLLHTNIGNSRTELPCTVLRTQQQKLRQYSLLVRKRILDNLSALVEHVGGLSKDI